MSKTTEDKPSNAAACRHEPVVMRQLTRKELSLLKKVTDLDGVVTANKDGYTISKRLIEEGYLNAFKLYAGPLKADIGQWEVRITDKGREALAIASQRLN